MKKRNVINNVIHRVPLDHGKKRRSNHFKYCVLFVNNSSAIKYIAYILRIILAKYLKSRNFIKSEILQIYIQRIVATGVWEDYILDWGKDVLNKLTQCGLA